ncbi:glycosyltransferase [Halomonas desiderata]|uniref:glycosyltransferase n=1 Tax=Billgrantia desiderata TaxID=52021 RepID=UPI00174D1463|nr:glycosyltransferase [Halomonas desiderata]
MRSQKTIFEQANDLYRKGQWVEAAELYASAISQNPHIHFYHFNYSLALKKIGKIHDAGHAAERGRKIQSRNGSSIGFDMDAYLGLSYVEAYEKLKNAQFFFHKKWYTHEYLLSTKEDPVEHYLKIGWKKGNKPNKKFCADFYKKEVLNNSDSVVPALHYLLLGKGDGVHTNVVAYAESKIQIVKKKLLTLGFVDKPIAELEELVNTSRFDAVRAMALRELALWEMRKKEDVGYAKAFSYLCKAIPIWPDSETFHTLIVAGLICCYAIGEKEKGIDLYKKHCIDVDFYEPNIQLALANYYQPPSKKIKIINKLLDFYGLAHVDLYNSQEGDLYDNLCSKDDLQSIEDGVLVSVIIAAYNSEKYLKTAIRSLQEQTWKNLEIIVVDDSSTDATFEVAREFSKHDTRIQVLKMDENLGAYVARNRALDVAHGKYVTLHDADDWSHPKKIEVQVKFLERNPKCIGCTSQQARVTSDLLFTRWTGSGHFITTNISSFMWSREAVRSRLGYWDTARFSSDRELMRRIKKVFGNKAIVELKSGPLSFQRDSASSIVADEALGINGFLYGARKEYLDAQTYHHEHGELYYNGDITQRPFPIPTIMLPKKAPEVEHFDVILASEFRMDGGSVHSCVQEIRAAKEKGLKVGLVELYRYDLGDKTRLSMLPIVRKEVDGNSVKVITYGEKATCQILVCRYPPIFQHMQRYVPDIKADKIVVVINQPPMSDYSDVGVKRYDLQNCSENIRHYFGKNAVWWPNGPMVRDALVTHHRDQIKHINLSPKNWDNIINLSEWKRTNYSHDINKTMRIGRHSRDSYVKWPDNKNDILAIYPDRKDVEVRILGGASTPAEIIGYTPANWTVHAFNSVSPKEFLSGLDVFVFFAHPDWVESFPRTVLEAMAVGVPVILPESHRELFGNNALYATPETALDTAFDIFKDRKLYYKQVEQAWKYLEQNYSYEMHVNRLIN